MIEDIINLIQKDASDLFEAYLEYDPYAPEELTEIAYKDNEPIGFPILLADIIINIKKLAKNLPFPIDLNEAVSIKEKFDLDE